MSHGFSRNFADKYYTFEPRPEFGRLLFDNEIKKIRGNPRESVAKAFE